LPVRGAVALSMMIVFIFLFVSNSLSAQSTRTKGAANSSKAQSTQTKAVADTSKVVVTEEYFETSEKKSALFDSSGRQLSTQQMVDFLKNELKKLNEQITTIVQKAAPDSGTASSADDVDVMKLFIIKGKLESMEKTLDEWMKQREMEVNVNQSKLPQNSQKGKP
jgi:hypothetical protein